MADVFTPEKRSWVMSRIRSRNTGIEIRMRDILEQAGCGFVMHPKMYGNPDFAIPQIRITIFCDGDFWHGYKYWDRKRPAKKFWRDKIEGNMRRDAAVSRKLRRGGWSVMRFWEHDIVGNPDRCAKRIKRMIRKSEDMGCMAGSRRVRQTAAPSP